MKKRKYGKRAGFWPVLVFTALFSCLLLGLAQEPPSVPVVLAETTNAPAGGIDLPLVNLLPVAWQKWAVILAALSPLIGRAWFAFRNGGGIKGVLASIWVGTNTPAKPDPK